MQSSRKRSRSDENVFSIQKKTFVNQHIVDSHNEEKMREIQNKTLKLLYAGARNLYNGKVPQFQGYEKNLRLSGDGTVHFIDEEVSKNNVIVRISSNCCKKLAFIRQNCSNCSLSICEFCGYSCVGCGTLLCTACVFLFDLGSDERSYCFQCQYFDMN